MIDVLGIALMDYLKGNIGEKLWVHNDIGEPEAYPIDYFFRDAADLPDLEKYALTQCEGHILDVGAGSGCHAILLQHQNRLVDALDISPGCCKIMRQRKIKNVLQTDLFDLKEAHQYDTLLFLMNGIGLSKTIAGLADFLKKCKGLLKPEGQILCDTSDLVYLFPDRMADSNHYYGEVQFKWKYKNIESEWFPWLYIDPDTLIMHAHIQGWEAEVIYETHEDHYLMRLTAY